MDLFVPASDVARLLNWSGGDFRALRRCLKPPLPIQRGTRMGRGKTPDMIQLEPLIKWLDRILPHGLNPTIAEQLADRSEPII